MLKLLVLKNLKRLIWLESVNQRMFSKMGILSNFKTDQFKIDKIKLTNSTTYILKYLHHRPTQGSFYETELQKSDQPSVYLVENVLRKKGDEVFVKCLDFETSHNSCAFSQWLYFAKKIGCYSSMVKVSCYSLMVTDKTMDIVSEDLGNIYESARSL